MSGPRCSDCGEELAVQQRQGRRVVLEHECPGPKEPRRDAPAPGTADGARRYG